jgi:hypothetical protein
MQLVHNVQTSAGVKNLSLMAFEKKPVSGGLHLRVSPGKFTSNRGSFLNQGDTDAPRSQIRGIGT